MDDYFSDDEKPSNNPNNLDFLKNASDSIDNEKLIFLGIPLELHTLSKTEQKIISAKILFEDPNTHEDKIIKAKIFLESATEERNLEELSSFACKNPIEFLILAGIGSAITYVISCVMCAFAKLVRSGFSYKDPNIS
ncbi:hypothetical protein GUI12_00500 [Anaplasmataceae bacterium AB001_6]|nr:hypothetical protein GUI12_00500 [Anaplasmataceae bacterium AB001_6]